jgi:hypothetical protein
MLISSAGLSGCCLRDTYRRSIDRDRTSCQLKSVPKLNTEFHGVQDVWKAGSKEQTDHWLLGRVLDWHCIFVSQCEAEEAMERGGK